GLVRHLFELGADRTCLSLVFLALIFGTSSLGLFLQILNLAVERAHGINRLVQTVDQALAFDISKAEFSYRLRNTYHRARQLIAHTAIHLRVLFLGKLGEFLLHL